MFIQQQKKEMILMVDIDYETKKLNTNISLELRVIKRLDVLSKKSNKSKSAIVNDILVSELKLDQDDE